MSPLEPWRFDEFFQALHGHAPFPWQTALAEQVCNAEWPDVIDLPTASGKTACMDIALFAMTVSDRAPRRIFFVVDRRMVVNEAFLRAKRIAEKLSTAQDGVLGTVAARLRELAQGDDPLRAYELRGGIYRDTSWVRNPLQPMVVTSTVDQTGSRLLFRGYGVSPKSATIHAGMIANDSIVILDEAHSSRAFAQTLGSISNYRSGAWAEQPLQASFAFVEMTATPSRESANPFRLSDADRANGTLQRRLFARKPARLVVSKGAIEKTLTDELHLLVHEKGHIRGAAIMVNRVGTARRVRDALVKENKPVELVIGRMRPLDRDDLIQRLGPLHSGAPRPAEREPMFVVSTQCLETGADLDFDVLVSECASVDALQQRFGRLDRLGDFGRASGAIVIAATQVVPKQPDPIYGTALSTTWNWLATLPQVNMGIEALPGEPFTIAQQLQRMDDKQSNSLRRFGADAPVLLPSHLDAFAQTSPPPCPDPDPALFLHGQKEGSPDVQVVWRADLREGEHTAWAEIIGLFPPVSAEAMPVPIHEFRRWMAGESADPDATDLEGEEDLAPGKQDVQSIGPVLAWRGDDSEIIHDPRRVRPGDTLVAPTSYKGWNTLGHKPDGSADDLAERACCGQTKRLRVRLQADVIATWKEAVTRDALASLAREESPEKEDVLTAFKAYQAEIGEGSYPWLDVLCEQGSSKYRPLIPYPDEAQGGWVLESRRRVEIEEDAGKDEPSGGEPITLKQHTDDVCERVRIYSSRLAEAPLRSALQCAAELHDMGKADVRFQALLRGGDMLAARFAPQPLAKGERPRTGGDARNRSGLPKDFRHELLSLQMAERAGVPEGLDVQLALHTIAAHHGHCRPFAPVVFDLSPEAVTYGKYALTGEERRNLCPPHRIDSGIPERFWVLTRRFGWWGLAWLEALFRLSDWAASRAPKS